MDHFQLAQMCPYGARTPKLVVAGPSPHLQCTSNCPSSADPRLGPAWSGVTRVHPHRLQPDGGRITHVTKRLIVNADDLGMSKGVNRGIIEGHQRGLITSTSVMTPTCPMPRRGSARRCQKRPTSVWACTSR